MLPRVTRMTIVTTLNPTPIATVTTTTTTSEVCSKRSYSSCQPATKHRRRNDRKQIQPSTLPPTLNQLSNVPFQTLADTHYLKILETLTSHHNLCPRSTATMRVWSPRPTGDVSVFSVLQLAWPFYDNVANNVSATSPVAPSSAVSSDLGLQSPLAPLLVQRSPPQACLW